MYFAREDICSKMVKCPKLNIFIFASFPVLILITCFFLDMPHFFKFDNLEMPHYSIFRIRWKMGYFKIFEHKKVSISTKNHVIDLKTGKEPKMNVFDFEAF